ncbi:hypothetical protein KJ611_01785 [Patescibacteria group bacterium]|nr:hypothetical protein [Patescibacteria group bacterium]MBU1705126.1 hypothetical protein [Patescibacteria group bacterium]
MKLLIQKLLIWLSKRIIRRHQPIIVAVTGSVGKTSTRNAIAAVLESSFRLRTNFANYNNEFGVPLTIIGAVSPEKSLIGWLKVIFHGAKQTLFKDQTYPQLLVLEFGADRPGDIGALCDIAQPDVAVLTVVSPVHAANYASFEQLIDEKTTIIRRVKPGGLAVLNADDARVLDHRLEAPARVLTYGFSQAADLRGFNYHLETRQDFTFDPGEQFAETHFEVEFEEETMPANLPNLIGRAQVSAALGALAVGRHFDLSLEDMIPRLAKILPQAGRMNPLPGIKKCLVLDDTYNAAPASVRAALEVLGQFTPQGDGQRIAALGQMAELGRYSRDEHRLIGHQVAEIGVSLLVTVGEEALGIRAGAIEAGLTDGQCAHFDNSEEAGRHLDKEVRTGDIVLVKGSQSARMEKVVKDLMAEPLRAEQLLVRQSEKWLKT